eukprot:COSAG05_NODE_7710_length_777_cov_1.259587_1_plen_104_part_00
MASWQDLILIYVGFGLMLLGMASLSFCKPIPDPNPTEEADDHADPAAAGDGNGEEPASGGRLGNLSSALKAKKDKVETYAVSPKEDEEGVARLATPPKEALNP